MTVPSCGALDRGSFFYDACMARVLVVDDEPRIAGFVSRALSAEGFQVDAAPDGVRGLELARSGRYELVVLDLLLPGRDGVSVLRDLMESRPDQRVLVLSALMDVENKVECLELGASDYLPKPFALAELVARVRARLRQPASGPDERQLRLGGVTLDLERRRADAGSGSVTLSEREFLLLRQLMLKGGEVCTRQRLLEDVWGYAFDPGSNVVDVCVGRLRAKLDSDVIETVRGVGYRFVAP
jgi:DNA-binding response OmpR family regulator